MARRTYDVLGRVLAVGLLALAPAATAAASAASPSFEPLPSVGLGGTPVEGGSAQDPTDLTAGIWAGTLSGPGQSDATTQWFRYTRTMADSTLLVGVVSTSLEEYGDAVAVGVDAPDGTPCGDGGSSSGTFEGSAFGAFITVGADENGERDSVCVSASELLIAVDRGTSSAASDQSFALRVVEEAPVTERGPVPAETRRVTFPQPGEATPEPGGRSFDDAPEVGPGTFSDAVPEGEERLWRVRLGWGQSLAVRVDVPQQDDATAERLGGATPALSLTPFNPFRDSFDRAVEDTDDEGPYSTSESTVLLEGAPPVAYLNRYDDISVTVPGDYWISLAASRADGRDPVDVPVEVTVAIDDAGTEPPTFAGSVLGPGSTAGPEGYDPATPYLVDDGVFAADVSGSPSVPGDDAAGGGSDDGLRRTSGLVLGALSLVSLAAGVVLLRRRRPR